MARLPARARTMPLSLRVVGMDLSLGGPPLAGDIARLQQSSAPNGRASSLFGVGWSSSSGTRVGGDSQSRSMPAPRPLGVAPLSRRTPPPSGFRAQRLETVVGRGRDAWLRSARALETADALDLPWARFWRAGKGSRWAVGDAVVVGARVLLPGLWVANLNRVVDVHRSRRRVSIAWGTTERHTLRGEEMLAVERDRNGNIVFSLLSYSRPKSFGAWLLYPYVVFLQHRFAHGVADRLKHIASASDDDD